MGYEQFFGLNDAPFSLAPNPRYLFESPSHAAALQQLTLANVDTPGGTMLQILLIGQLDLESLLARPDLRQVQQRVSRRIRLEPLDQAQLAAYIDHRLAVSRTVESPMPGAGDLARAISEW